MNRTPTPPAPVELPIGCWRINCGRAAVCEVLDQMMADFMPACHEHSKHATPFEKRALTRRRSA